MRAAITSILLVSIIGYLFGVVFGIRAIQMSDLAGAPGDVLRLVTWVGVTFAVLFIPLGLIAHGFERLVSRVRGNVPGRAGRTWILVWVGIGGTIAIPFVGYFFSSGVEAMAVDGAGSRFDLLPVWALRLLRWMGFSALSAGVLAFGVAGLSEQVRRGRRPALLLVLGGVVAIGLFPVVWYGVLGRGETPLPDSAYVTPADALARSGVDEPVGPIVVVGWDGADWSVIDPLLEAGKLPNLAGLIEGGVRAPLLSFEPTSSPLIWTTISTGRPPGRHGIRSQVQNRFVGMSRWFFFPPSMGFDRIFGPLWEALGVLDRVQITSLARTAPAFWDVLDRAGRRTGLINWRVSWPVERFAGFSVTGRIDPYLNRLVGENGHIGAVTAAELQPLLADVIHPAVSPELLDDAWTEHRSRTATLVKESGLPEELAPEHEVLALEVGLRLAARDSVDVLGAYFYEIDSIEHLYWCYREPEYFFGVDEVDVARYGDAIDQIHVFTDALLGRLLEVVPDDATVILLSDHGHGAVFGEPRRSGGHSHAPPGILVMKGPAIKPDARVEAPSVFDIFPTIMYLSGCPVERSSEGRVLLDALRPEVVRDRPPRTIPDYGRREPDRGREMRFDRDIEGDNLRELRRLGYIG